MPPTLTETKPRPTPIKSFSWSYSKLKNYETCPRRYEATEITKTAEQQRSQELDRGDELHAAMYSRVTGSAPLPPQFIYMESWAKKLTSVLHPLQIIQCELKLSTDAQGKPTGYFDKTTWLRGKIDYFRMFPASVPNVDVGHIVDYKTGRPPKVFDPTQLLLNAHLVFASYKTVQKVRVDYLWTEYNDTTHDDFQRADIAPAMAEVTLRVSAMEEAHRDNNFPPTPNGLCAEYCPVSACEFYGKKIRRG